ncbi:hypothetical protein MHH33_13150 [Paenisporosarcina sp. FSL H8-0542]|uniref:hypothetical protein n=1 Tax=Paenisporosarcina sp. FSL H8-0542 TaxID=2921401 RepID=UPI00315B015F
MATQKKSKWSLAFSIIGVIAFGVSYFISKNPTFIEKIVIGILFIFGIILMVGGIISGICAFKTKEKGILKYIGFLVIILLVIGLALPLLLMVLFGFGG